MDAHPKPKFRDGEQPWFNPTPNRLHRITKLAGVNFLLEIVIVKPEVKR